MTPAQEGPFLNLSLLRLQKRYSPPTSGQSGEQREALSRCRPGVRASPSRVLWKVLLQALRADMEIPERMERWHMYPSPSHAVPCDPLEMHPKSPGSRRTRSWQSLEPGHLPPLCPANAAATTAGNPQATPAPRPGDRATHSDPGTSWAKWPAEVDICLLSPKVKPGQELLAPRMDDRSCQTLGNVLEGIFILRTSFYSRWGREGDRVSLAPGLWV